MPPRSARRAPHFVVTLFLLLFASAAAAALPLRQTRQIDDISPTDNPPSELGFAPFFRSLTLQVGDSEVLAFKPGLDVVTASHVLIDFVSTVAPDAPQPDILLIASSTSVPPEAQVSDDAGTCSQWKPCLPEQADDTAFYTHATRASALLVDVASSATVYVRVRNFDRGRGHTQALTGTLRIRREDSRPICGGLGEAGECAGHGSCVESAGDEALGKCECESTWGGRFCDKRVEAKPETFARPSPVPDAPLGLPGAASVKVGAGKGRYFRWDVPDGPGKVLVWARVQRGTVLRADGEEVAVGGGGPGVGLYARVGGVPEERDEDRVSLRETGRGDGEKETYEFAKVIESERGELYLWLQGNASVAGGDGLYSVKVRRCGGSGEGVCPFEEKGGGFPTGIAIGVGAVLGVVVLAVVVGLLIVRAVRGRRERKKGMESGVAWEQVTIGGPVSGGSKSEREEWRRKEERLKKGVGDLDCSTTASSPASTPGRSRGL